MKGLIHLLMVIGIEDLQGDLNLRVLVRLASKEKKRGVSISLNSGHKLNLGSSKMQLLSTLSLRCIALIRNPIILFPGKSKDNIQVLEVLL